MASEPDSGLLTMILSNQMKLLASGQVLMIQQARLIAALTQADPMVLMDEFDGLFRQEKNKLHLAMLAELRNLQGGPQTGECGGGLEGAG